MSSDADTPEMGRPTAVSRRDRHRILADPERRLVLDELAARTPPVSIESLATAIAERTHAGDGAAESPTGALDDERIRQLTVALHHRHLPMLASFGLVEYDGTENRVVAVADAVGMYHAWHLEDAVR